jgi:flagellar motor component MotA
MKAIKDGLLAAMRGSTPAVAVEFSRRALFTDERPSGDELSAALKSVQLGGRS